jgi:hypothetical protein
MCTHVTCSDDEPKNGQGLLLSGNYVLALYYRGGHILSCSASCGGMHRNGHRAPSPPEAGLRSRGKCGQRSPQEETRSPTS